MLYSALISVINQSISSCTYSPDRNPDELVWKHLRADTVGRMTITDKADFKAKVRASMCQLQNDPEKIRTKNYRSNMPPDSAFTYGLINTSSMSKRTMRLRSRIPTRSSFQICGSCSARLRIRRRVSALGVSICSLLRRSYSSAASA